MPGFIRYLFFSTSFFILATTKNQILFFTALLVCLTAGIHFLVTISMHQTKNSANDQEVQDIVKQGDGKSRIPNFIALLFLQFLAAFIIFAIVYLFFHRKEIWANI